MVNKDEQIKFLDNHILTDELLHFKKCQLNTPDSFELTVFCG